MSRALRGQPTDRPALAYLFLGGARHVLGHVGKRMNEAYGDAHLMAATQAAATELFEHDSAMIPWGCLTVEAEAFGCHIEKLEDYYPRVTGRPLEEDRNLARLSDPDPSSSGRMPLVLEALSRLRQRSGDDLFIVALVVSPFLVACELRGMAKLLMDFINDPPYVESLFQRVTEGTERYLQAILHTGACDAVLFENNFSAHIPTTSAYASMLTGLDCFSTSVVALRHKGGLPKKIRTLPEILRKNGYNTSCVGFSGNPSSRGFSKYLDYPVGAPSQRAVARRPKTSTRLPSPSWNASRNRRNPSFSSCAIWTHMPPICRRPPSNACFTAAMNSTQKISRWSRFSTSNLSATSSLSGCLRACATATMSTRNTTGPSPIWMPVYNTSLPASTS